jgi:hypothetical protein
MQGYDRNALQRIFGGRLRLLLSRMPAWLVVSAVLAGAYGLQRLDEAQRPQALSEGATRTIAAHRSGRIAWVIEPGRRIKAGDIVAALEGTQRLSALRSPAAGTVRMVLKSAGDVAGAGDPLVILGVALESPNPPVSSNPSQSPNP